MRYILIMHLCGGGVSAIDVGYRAYAQAEAHGQHLCKTLPEVYAGYTVKQVQQQPA